MNLSIIFVNILSQVISTYWRFWRTNLTQVKTQNSYKNFKSIIRKLMSSFSKPHGDYKPALIELKTFPGAVLKSSAFLSFLYKSISIVIYDSCDYLCKSIHQTTVTCYHHSIINVFLYTKYITL